MIELADIMVYLFRILIFPGIFFILGMGLTYDWLYRKILARFQLRVGPSVAGPGGILQTIADFIKTSAKEEITPKKAHKIVFNWLPVLAPLPVMVGIFFLPINMEAGLLSNEGDIYALIFLLALFASIQISLGWASGNKFALIGASRSGLQLVSFGIPLVFSAIFAAMQAESLRLVDIVNYQTENNWMVTVGFGAGFIAFVIFLVTSLAELEKVPFDTPEAETELAGGWTVEYSGRKYAFIMLGELLKEVFMVGLAVTLFLGGPVGPTFGLEGFAVEILFTVYFLAKCAVVIFLLSILSASLARLKISQITEGAWSLLAPISVVTVGLIVLV